MMSGTDTRQRIIDAARDLIFARSYADVGVQAICEQARVKKGSFYYFFRSKQELTLSVVEDLVALFRGMLGEAFSASVSPLERLQRMVRATYEMQRDLKDAHGCVLGCPFGNLAVEMSTQDEVLRRRLDGVFSDVVGYFEQALQEAADVGELPGVDVAATAQAMFAYMEGLMLLAKTRNDPQLLLRLGPAVANIRVPSGRDGAYVLQIRKS
jgi:TetR/AcrR family transcriptional repressor of nem operon